jgi:hypothetical protein
MKVGFFFISSFRIEQRFDAIGIATGASEIFFFMCMVICKKRRNDLCYLEPDLILINFSQGKDTPKYHLLFKRINEIIYLPVPLSRSKSYEVFEPLWTIVIHSLFRAYFKVSFHCLKSNDNLTMQIACRNYQTYKQKITIDE